MNSNSMTFYIIVFLTTLILVFCACGVLTTPVKELKKDGLKNENSSISASPDNLFQQEIEEKEIKPLDSKIPANETLIATNLNLTINENKRKPAAKVRIQPEEFQYKMDTWSWWN
ncbi:unnamed protein product [Orchesella dallaii]|uniref:Lipoprotein n=1 Tax=Orchesella dallaii TaxID=48710 RepID=A0ABP1RQ61_9HEXA